MDDAEGVRTADGFDNLLDAETAETENCRKQYYNSSRLEL